MTRWIETLSLKNPAVAGEMPAIIPGSEYVYSGRKGTELTSFIVNGLVLWAIRDAVYNKQYGLATTVRFFGVGWYVGNIKDSIDAAKVYNANIRHAFINELLQEGYMDCYVKQ